MSDSTNLNKSNTLPSFRKIAPEDFPDQSDWIDKLLGPMNNFMTTAYDNMNKSPELQIKTVDANVVITGKTENNFNLGCNIDCPAIQIKKELNTIYAVAIGAFKQLSVTTIQGDGTSSTYIESLCQFFQRYYTTSYVVKNYADALVNIAVPPYSPSCIMVDYNNYIWSNNTSVQPSSTLMSLLITGLPLPVISAFDHNKGMRKKIYTFSVSISILGK